MCETCERVAEALHSAEHDQAEHVEEITEASVRIAQIEADKEITLARLAAGVEKTIVAAETDADLVEAETKAAVLGDVVESLSPDPAPAAPVVVVNDGQEAEPTDPPKAEDRQEPEVPKEKPRPRGFF